MWNSLALAVYGRTKQFLCTSWFITCNSSIQYQETETTYWIIHWVVLWGLLSRAVIIYPMSVLNAKVIEYILFSGIFFFFWQFSLIWSFPNSRVCLKTVFLCVPTIETICLKTWPSCHGFLKCSLTEIQSDYFLKLWVILHSEKLDVEKFFFFFPLALKLSEKFSIKEIYQLKCL